MNHVDITQSEFTKIFVVKWMGSNNKAKKETLSVWIRREFEVDTFWMIDDPVLSKKKGNNIRMNFTSPEAALLFKLTHV